MRIAKIKLYIKNHIVLFSLYIIVVSCFLATLNKLSFVVSLQVSCFQIFAMLLPGLAFLITIGYVPITSIEELLLGYVLGYCYNIIVYYILLPFHGNSIILWLLLATTALSSIIVICKKYKYEDTNWNDYKTCMLFISVVLVILAVAYNCKNLSPSITAGNSFTADELYWIGNTIELTSFKYPPMDFRVYGQTYFYHYFPSVQMAIFSMVTGQDVSTLTFGFSYFQSGIMLVAGAYLLFKTILSKYLWVVISMIIFLFTAGQEFRVLVTFIYHIYTDLYAYHIGIPLSLVSVGVFVKQIENDKFSLREYIVTMLTFCVCLGSSATIGGVILAGMGIVCLFWLSKKQWKLSMIYGISLLLIFALMTLFILRGWLETTGTNSTLHIAPFALLKDNPNLYVFDKFTNIGIPYYFVYLIKLIYTLFFSNPVIWACFITGLIIKFKCKRKFTIVDTFLFITALIGVALSFTFKAEGFSQMGFMFPSFSLMLVFGMKEIMGNIPNLRFNRKYCFAFAIIICYGMMNSFYSLKAPLYKGISNLIDVQNTLPSSNANAVTLSEYECYNWIRERTSKNDIICSDKILQKGNTRSFVVGVFTERHVFMEGYAYNDIAENMKNERLELISAMYLSNQMAIQEIINKHHVKYVIQTNFVSPDFTLDKRYGDCVFENNEMKVYELVDKI